MRIVWISCFVLAMSVVASAEVKKPAVKKPDKDFWKILVAPKAKWVLHESDNKTSSVTVETYDVRTIEQAQVARLRWTHNDGTGESTFGGGAIQPTQVAVTRDGLYLLDAAMDDAAVTVALKKKPSRSSPPKAYKGTKQNGGRYLTVQGGEVCMGWAKLAADGPCEDVCEDEVCFSTKGVTSITGFNAPGGMIWAQ